MIDTKEMSTEDTPVKDLLNIGPKTARLLEEIEIYTKKNLRDIGPEMAFKILQHRNKGVTTVALYALYGALHDIHWNELPPDIKSRLQKEAVRKLDIDI